MCPNVADCCFSENKADLIIISLKINLFSPWYSWKITELALNNNHSLFNIKTIYFDLPKFSNFRFWQWWDSPKCSEMSSGLIKLIRYKYTCHYTCIYILNTESLEHVLFKSISDTYVAWMYIQSLSCIACNPLGLILNMFHKGN